VTTQTPLPTLAANLADLVRTVIGEVRPRLVEAALSGQRGEQANTRHTDNFLSSHDLWMHQRYLSLLSDLLPSFVYASEEDEPQVVGKDPDPDLCVLVDPLDTSEMAVRGLYGYTHVMVYSRALARPVAAVVGDIFHHFQLYLAARDDDGQDRAYLITADAQVHSLSLHGAPPVDRALVTNFFMKPAERFVPLAGKTRLVDALSRPGPDGRAHGRIGLDFGSVSLCHVAAGLTDATIEFAKGFAIWDLAPGRYILHSAGGTVIDLSGQPIPLDADFGSLVDIAKAMEPRQRFIAAADEILAADLLALLDI
jgi:myo-inositol-1(or 4)-monophosphatase